MRLYNQTRASLRASRFEVRAVGVECDGVENSKFKFLPRPNATAAINRRLTARMPRDLLQSYDETVARSRASNSREAFVLRAASFPGKAAAFDRR